MITEDDVQEDSASTNSAAVPFGEKVRNWFDQDDQEINMPDEPQFDHDFLLEPEPDVERYSALYIKHRHTAGLLQAFTARSFCHPKTIAY